MTFGTVGQAHSDLTSKHRNNKEAKHDSLSIPRRDPRKPPRERASNRSVENRLHRFAADGSFAAQAGSKTEMKPGLVYRYRPEGRVGMDGLLYQVKSVQPDEFVLHIAGNNLLFRKGPCK